MFQSLVLPRLLAGVVAAVLLVSLTESSGAPPARAASPAVSVFPSPGTQYNRPATQIVFRGVPADQLGTITVTGSVTGAHSGQIEADSDGSGASFVPDSPFANGETVTVTTDLDVPGASGGSFSFRIANSWGLIPYGHLPLVSGPHGTQSFHSRPDLSPASLTVDQDHAPLGGGDIFVAPEFGPRQNGPMILDRHGKVVWFLPYSVSRNLMITDFKVQRYQGQPALTWWQGNTNAGLGRGVGVIYNKRYQRVATVRAGNGLDMDLHEFLITPQGHAYITAASPVHLPGISKPTVDAVVQEIDIKTGLVLFEWHALDHIPLQYSYYTASRAGTIYDPYHVNSVAVTRDGNLLISMRNTSAVYKVNHTTGQIMWTLGGKDSSFRMGAHTTTFDQHDAVMEPDGTITMFDDGAGPPKRHPYSRGVHEALNFANMSASLVHAYGHAPTLSANYEGSTQALSAGNVFLGWGQQPYFSETNAAGLQLFDAHFDVPTASYRAYRLAWSGQPTTAPALAVSRAGRASTELYASWNGATDVATWRVLAGPDPGAMTTVGRFQKGGFETDIRLHLVAPYFEVQALGPAGHVLATSKVHSGS